MSRSRQHTRLPALITNRTKEAHQSASYLESFKGKLFNSRICRHCHHIYNFISSIATVLGVRVVFIGTNSKTSSRLIKVAMSLPYSIKVKRLADHSSTRKAWLIRNAHWTVITPMATTLYAHQLLKNETRGSRPRSHSFKSNNRLHSHMKTTAIANSACQVMEIRRRLSSIKDWLL